MQKTLEIGKLMQMALGMENVSEVEKGKGTKKEKKATRLLKTKPASKGAVKCALMQYFVQ